MKRLIKEYYPEYLLLFVFIPISIYGLFFGERITLQGVGNIIACGIIGYVIYLIYVFNKNKKYIKTEDFEEPVELTHIQISNYYNLFLDLGLESYVAKIKKEIDQEFNSDISIYDQEDDEDEDDIGYVN